MMNKAMLERLAIAALFLSFLFVGMGAAGMFRAKGADSSGNRYQPGNDYFKVGPDNKPSWTTVVAPIGDLNIYLGKPGAYVTIKKDGTVIYGDDYDPDVMAKAFWENLGERRNCK